MSRNLWLLFAVLGAVVALGLSGAVESCSPIR